VLLPNYNAGAFLRPAIDSILAQDYQDFELLVIDDASSDGSQDGVSAYRDPRVRFVRHEVNRGLGATLNEGLRLARGALIARQDCDDLSSPARLGRQTAAFHAEPALVQPEVHFGTLAMLPDNDRMGSQAANMIFELEDNHWKIDNRRVELPLSVRTVGVVADLVPPARIAELTSLVGAPYCNSFGATECGWPPASKGIIPVGVVPTRLAKEQSSYGQIRLVDENDRDVEDGRYDGYPDLGVSAPTLSTMILSAGGSYQEVETPDGRCHLSIEAFIHQGNTEFWMIHTDHAGRAPAGRHTPQRPVQRRESRVHGAGRIARRQG
jgi:hypothetical protein